MPRPSVGFRRSRTQAARPVLLDTHTWIWHVARDACLMRKRSVANEIDKAREDGELLLSAMSIWEVGMLESKGRIQLGMDCMDWVRLALERSGVRVVPLPWPRRLWRGGGL